MQIIEKISFHDRFVKYSILLAMSILLGISFIKSPLYIIFILLAIPSIVLLKIKPLYGIIIVTIVVSTIIFENTLPLFSFGFGSFNYTDIIILYLLIITFFDRDNQKMSWTIKIFILYFIYLFISAVIAINWKELDFNIAMRVLRGYFYFMLAYIVSNQAKTRKDILFLEKGLAILAVFVAFAMIAQAILGESLILTPGRIDKTSSFTYETFRILPPGQTLVFAVFIVSMGLFVFRDQNSLTKWQLLIFGTTFLGVLLTYNRSYWVAALLSLIFFIILGGARGVGLLVRRAVLGGAIVLFFISGLVLGNFGLTTSFSASVSDRFETLFEGRNLLTSSSIRYREMENIYALNKLADAPAFGVGPGNDYRPKNEIHDDALTKYIHNGYLGIALHSGIPGLIFFLAFYLSFIGNAFKGLRKIEDDFQKAILRGILAFSICILLINIVNPMFQQWFSVVVMGVIIGLSESIIKVFRTAKIQLNA
jgi:O-antigen ligase